MSFWCSDLYRKTNKNTRIFFNQPHLYFKTFQWCFFCILICDVTVVYPSDSMNGYVNKGKTIFVILTLYKKYITFIKTKISNLNIYEIQGIIFYLFFKYICCKYICIIFWFKSNYFKLIINILNILSSEFHIKPSLSLNFNSIILIKLLMYVINTKSQIWCLL